MTVTLLEAYQLYGEADLGRAARETCDYILREMTHPAGGFYSAQDADSLNPGDGHSEEGFFCTYDYAELRQFLTGEELAALTQAYGVTPQGNFEGRNILHVTGEIDPEIWSTVRTKLAELRASRPSPHLDDKVIVAWNGWMIWALAKASRAFNEPRYLAAAQKALSFLKDNLVEAAGEGLHRFWREGQAKGAATAEDYASLILACIEVNQCDLSPEWAKWALQLQRKMDQLFWDSEDGTYFANDGRDPHLPLRPKDDYDGVTPCSNSLAAYNLARLFALTGDIKLRNAHERLTQSLFSKLKQYPSGLPFLALALDFAVADARVAVVSGGGWTEDLRLASAARFEPHLLWARPESGWPVGAGKESAEPRLYVCTSGHCLEPVSERGKAEALLRT